VLPQLLHVAENISRGRAERSPPPPPPFCARIALRAERQSWQRFGLFWNPFCS